jgi:hypothetical protein
MVAQVTTTFTKLVDYSPQACHEDVKDENLIRKCKCKNFVSGLLAHSVVKSQLLAQVGGLGMKEGQTS